MTFTVGKHKTKGDHVAHVLHECDGSPTYLVGYIESHHAYPEYPCQYPMIWRAADGAALPDNSGGLNVYEKFDLAAPEKKSVCYVFLNPEGVLKVKSYSSTENAGWKFLGTIYVTYDGEKLKSMALEVNDER